MLNRKNSVWLSVLLLVLAAGMMPQQLQAQQSDSLDIEDPFEDDPFFSKPIDDMLHRPPKDWVQTEEVRRRIHYMNRAGLDYGDSFENGPFISNPIYGLYPVMPMIHYNRVNGVFLGIKKERMTWDRYDDFLGIESITPQGMIGYSFGQDEWQYSFGLEKYFGDRPLFALGAEYYNGTSTDDYWRVGLNETSITALFAGYDFLDYYKQKGYGLYAMFRTPTYIDLAVSYNSTAYSSLQQQTDYSFFGKNGTYRVNPPITEGDFETLSLGFMFNRRNVIMSQFFSMQGWALAELGKEFGLNSDVPYNRYQAGWQFYFYLDKGTMLKWRLRAGSITGDGDIPLQKQFELGGIGTMRATPFKQMKGNAMVLSNIELHFGSSNVMGDMEWMDAEDLTLSFFLDSGWTRWEEQLLNGNDPLAGFDQFNFDDLHHDAGVGLGTNLFRAEVAWPIDSIGKGTPALWFRFNPTF
jgi:hypothetical protein